MDTKQVILITGGVTLAAAGLYGISYGVYCGFNKIFSKPKTKQAETIVPDLETVIAAMPETRFKAAGEPPAPYVAQDIDVSAYTKAEDSEQSVVHCPESTPKSPIQNALQQQHEQINGIIDILKNDSISVIRGLNDIGDSMENIMIQTEQIITDNVSDDLDSDSELVKMILPDRKTRSQLLQQLSDADKLRNDAFAKLHNKKNRNVFETINLTKQTLFDAIVLVEDILTEIAKINLVQQGDTNPPSGTLPNHNN